MVNVANLETSPEDAELYRNGARAIVIYKYRKGYDAELRDMNDRIRTVNSIELSLMNGAAQLDIQHFAEAWAMQEGCAPGRNVFLSPHWSQVDLAGPVAA